MERFAGRILSAINNLDFEQRQKLIRMVVDEVTVKGRQVKIRLRISLGDGSDGDGPAKRQLSSPNTQMSTNERLRSIGIEQAHRIRQGQA